METKQTAVEWLFKQLWEEPKDKMVWYAILDEAKEIEKEQIINALGVGCQIKPTGLIGYYEMGEQYYEETYGK